MKLENQKKVKTLQEEFSRETGLYLRVYQGNTTAKEDTTLENLKIVEGEVEFSTRMKIATVEDSFKKLNLKVQIASADNSRLCNDNYTLAKAKNKMGSNQEENINHLDVSNVTNMDFIFINTTTNLPIDQDGIKMFYRVFDRSIILDEFERRHDDKPIQIYCVSTIEIDESIQEVERQKHTGEMRDHFEIPEENNDFRPRDYDPQAYQFNPDALGVYISCCQELQCRSIIKVSPEKIMIVAYHLKQKFSLIESCSEIFYMLFVKVVIHELGHYYMDAYDHHLHLERVSSIARGLDENDNPNRYIERLLDSNYRHHCSSYDLRRMALLDNTPWDKWLEESLANIFAMQHKWTENEKTILWKFIESQPGEYSAALSWKSTKEITKTILSWVEFKRGHPYDHIKAINALDTENEIFDDLIQKLSVHKSIASFDFVGYYHLFCKKHIKAWVETQNEKLYNLYGVLGMLIKNFKDSNSTFALWCCNERLKVETDNNARKSVFEIIAEIYAKKGDKQKQLNALKEALKHSERLTKYEYDIQDTKKLKQKIKDIEND